MSGFNLKEAERLQELAVEFFPKYWDGNMSDMSMPHWKKDKIEMTANTFQDFKDFLAENGVDENFIDAIGLSIFEEKGGVIYFQVRTLLEEIEEGPDHDGFVMW